MQSYVEPGELEPEVDVTHDVRAGIQRHMPVHFSATVSKSESIDFALACVCMAGLFLAAVWSYL